MWRSLVDEFVNMTRGVWRNELDRGYTNKVFTHNSPFRFRQSDSLIPAQASLLTLAFVAHGPFPIRPSVQVAPCCPTKKITYAYI
jgi:hypothetical protein